MLPSKLAQVLLVVANILIPCLFLDYLQTSSVFEDIQDKIAAQQRRAPTQDDYRPPATERDLRKALQGGNEHDDQGEGGCADGGAAAGRATVVENSSYADDNRRADHPYKVPGHSSVAPGSAGRVECHLRKDEVGGVWRQRCWRVVIILIQAAVSFFGGTARDG
ncbi:unnamed protein product [Vitrella brassicaformis CCMP3155]|uniref:Uncharacterized protein n=1 Tax=Vitrella brassicaformis (strain CCMP3155) TaxID=1169540 RepID=A0A0G4EVY2_VITBC|nr:unnamed protein product [Vitrella brassicaformis CCMP3155]|eukprot:CEM02367.1 unnamed protein product [Vitrella brassicaformis CCMP3155]